MKLLLLTQWFEPEPAFKGLTFARALRDAGHEVQVLTGFPNYPGGRIYSGYRIRPVQRETVDNVSVVRVPLYPSHGDSAIGRALNYLSFAAATSILGPFFVRRPDVVYVYQPPATAAMAALIFKALFRARVIVDVQDLWPDTLAATGMISNKGVLAVVRAWCRLVYRAADHVIVLSQGFRRRLVDRKVPDRKISVVLNWAGDEMESSPPAVTSLRQRVGLPSDAVVVLYAGNIGRAQNLSALLPAMANPAVRAAGLYLVLMGGGLEYRPVERQIASSGLANVKMLSSVPKAEAQALIREADGLLVHLRSDPLFAITIPSKVQSYLNAGVPILAGVSGEARELIESAGAGMAFEPDSERDFARVLVEFAETPRHVRLAMGSAGRQLYKERLSFDRAIRVTTTLLESLA